MEAVERGDLMITGNYKVYTRALDARGSEVMKMLNPTQLFPVDATKRAFSTVPHLVAEGRADLTPQEFYTLILAIDMGMNFYSRENNTHSAVY
jgi:hypothetical protein